MTTLGGKEPLFRAKQSKLNFLMIWRLWEARGQICKIKWSMEMCLLSSYVEQFGRQKGLLFPANKQKLIEIWRDTKTCLCNWDMAVNQHAANGRLFLKLPSPAVLYFRDQVFRYHCRRGRPGWAFLPAVFSVSKLRGTRMLECQLTLEFLRQSSYL